MEEEERVKRQYEEQEAKDDALARDLLDCAEEAVGARVEAVDGGREQALGSLAEFSMRCAGTQRNSPIF